MTGWRWIFANLSRMPDSPMQSFQLIPFAAPDEPVVHAIDGTVKRTVDALEMCYRLRADLARLRIAAPGEPRFTDGLWRHTCFELFIAHAGGAAYHELNFSPSRAWAAYAFAAYRERHPWPLDADALAQRVDVNQAGEVLAVSVSLPLGLFPACYAEASLRLGIAAVVEHADGALSYWALGHPRDQPDFHHPDAFVLEFDEIRH
jgi:hypothetical protein